MATLPFEAQVATVDGNGTVYVAGSSSDDEPDPDFPGVACALDGNLRPRWTARLFDRDIDGLFFVGERLYASRYPDVCVAIDPATGAVLTMEAPLLPSRMSLDVDGSFLCHSDDRILRARLGLRTEPGEAGFGFDEVPLFDPPPAPARGFFAELFSAPPPEPTTGGARFPVPMGDGSFVAFDTEPRAALVRFDRAGNRSVFAGISGEYQLDEIDDLQRAGELLFLRADQRLLLAHRGVVSDITSIEDLLAFAALPDGNVVLFGDDRIVLARREDGYRVG
jgi:hypothetical protein